MNLSRLRENTFLYQKTSESKGKAGYRCLKAGLDVELPMPEAFREMKELFENGEADEAYVDAAVLRKLEPKCRSLLQVLREQLPGTEILYAPGYYKAGADEGLFEETLEIVKEADAVILTLGGKNGSGSIATMAEGVDGTNVNLPACPHRPRYCFGHGLSYTSFSYSDPTIDKKEVSPFEKLTVSVKVKSTGRVAGTEVVQLYLRDVQALMTRPNKELQGFVRVELQPGEEKSVRFTVSPSQMAFVDENMKWKNEKGEYEVQLAASSEEVRLTGSYVVTKNAWLEGRDRAFYAGLETGE